MKRIFAALLALCCLLSACGAPPGGAENNSGTASGLSPSAAGPDTGAPEPDVAGKKVQTGSQGSYETLEYETELVDLERLGHGEPVLICETEPIDWFKGERREWHKEKVEIWGYDARSFDLSGEDLSDIEDPTSISFNTRTIWPDADKLPPDYDAEAILELGKDPGLGIRALHEQGITGESVSIAIIDQALYTGHEQYRDNLMLYECIHQPAADEAVLHGAAVASIAVGKDTGVAPGAKLYYIASTFGEYTADGEYLFDASIMAQCIDRVLQINTQLPEDERIRVISISRGANRNNTGFPELAAAIERANEQGILVLTTTTRYFYDGFNLQGMGRECMADPNDPASYTTAAWLGTSQPVGKENAINVPMGARTYAACGGAEGYEWSGEGGLSWAVPWMAGFYALCCQVEPELTPEQFIRVVNETAVLKLKNGALKNVEVKYALKYDYGKIIDPAAIAALRDA